MTRPRRTRPVVALAVVAALVAATTPATAGAARAPAPGPFRRLATVPAYLNAPAGGAAAAEISTVTADGRTVVYTDGPGRRLGFLDITDPSRPVPTGTLDTGGEPTSVAHLGHLLLAAVNAGRGVTDPAGTLLVIDDRTRAVRRTVDLGGQPDSVAVAPSGRYIAVAVENERDEDVDGGAIPQPPAGWLAVIDTRTWRVDRVDLTGLAQVAPSDPEPEYVSINARDEAVVSLQENNHLAVVSLPSRRVISHFSAGQVTVSGVDTADDDQIVLDGTLTAAREPDGVAWISDDLFATANEGDYRGGSRGWSIFDRRGHLVWDAGNSLEHLAVAHGLYPDKRSDARGIEPENVAFARMRGVPYLFVTAERGNFTAVYDLTRPQAPRFRQLLPTTNGPEGVLAVPSRGLVVVSSEEEIPDANIRGSVQIYGFGAGAFPSVVSRGEIPWGTLSGLSAVPGRRDRLVAVTDPHPHPRRVVAAGGHHPATHRDQVRHADRVRRRRPGGHAGRLLARGRGAQSDRPPRRPRGRDAGDPAAAGGRRRDHLERVRGHRADRPLRLGRDPTRTADRPHRRRADRALRHPYGRWAFLGYPLEKPPTGWDGLSELVALDDDTFAVIERDNQRGPAAAVKRIYRFDVPATWTGLPTVHKRLVKDLLPALGADNGWIPDKVEGLAVAGNGEAYAVTDNDALDDATGETVLLRLGRLRQWGR